MHVQVSNGVVLRVAAKSSELPLAVFGVVLAR
jgi:hypothetical protein